MALKNFSFLGIILLSYHFTYNEIEQTNIFFLYSSVEIMKRKCTYLFVMILAPLIYMPWIFRLIYLSYKKNYTFIKLIHICLWNKYHAFWQYFIVLLAWFLKFTFGYLNLFINHNVKIFRSWKENKLVSSIIFLQ